MAGGRTGYERVVSHLRELILAGDEGKRVTPGNALPGQTRLAAELSVNVTIVNRAFAAVTAEGLALSAGRGKPTIVLPRQSYKVTATVTPRKAGADAGGLYEALASATATDPLSGPVAVTAGQGDAAIVLTVEMPDAAWAVTRAAAAIRAAIGDDWNITGAASAEA